MLRVVLSYLILAVLASTTHGHALAFEPEQEDGWAPGYVVLADGELLEGEERARATDAGLHLVEDEHRAGPIGRATGGDRMVRARALFGGDGSIVCHEMLNGNQPQRKRQWHGVRRHGSFAARRSRAC
jgi:hypothetical protein